MDNNLAVPQVGREGASSRMGASSVTLTCRICDLSTTQAPGIRLRTICPRCGNFYANDQHSEHARSTVVAGPSISGSGGGASVLGADANREVRLRNRSNSRWQSSPTPERLPSLEKRVSSEDLWLLPDIIFKVWCGATKMPKHGIRCRNYGCCVTAVVTFMIVVVVVIIVWFCLSSLTWFISIAWHDSVIIKLMSYVWFIYHCLRRRAIGLQYHRCSYTVFLLQLLCRV